MNSSLVRFVAVSRILLTIVFMCFFDAALSQQIVNHISRTFSSDDGNPAYDEDGVRNGTVIWRGGAVHVVYRYEVYGTTEFPNPVFIIRQGAIVKFAFQFSTSGGITWTAATDGWIAARGFNSPIENVTIQIDGAAITDIRDDAIGGDTNGDGTASTPSFWGDLFFSGSPRDAVRNSTIKYSLNIYHFGSMEFSGNTFSMFGGFRYLTGLGSSVLNASPRFIGNTFQRSFSNVGLDLRGMTPIVENNTFRDTLTGYAIRVGPAAAQSGGQIINIGPSSGTIVISNNRFETKQGISLSESAQESLFTKGPTIRAEIRGNTLRAPRNVGDALELALEAEAAVSNNNISNYSSPVRFYFSNEALAGNRTRCGLHINNNHFSLEGVSSFFALGWFPPPTSPAATNGVLIDMKNNDWGDPSGPFVQFSNRPNPRGRGLTISSSQFGYQFQHIDYVPFIGAANPPQRDVVRLAVSSPSTSTPLTPGATVTLNSNIDFYDLVSAPTGQIVVLLRDADGIILNNPGTIVNVTSGNHTATIPPIPFTVPTLGNTVRVEALLAPAGDFAAVRSNLVSFNVNLPPSNLHVSGTYQDIPGNANEVRLTITYTLASTNPGTIELDFREREVSTGTELSRFPLITLPAPPGNGRTFVHTTTLSLPLRDVSRGLKREYFLVASLKNDAGTVVSRHGSGGPIDDRANRVRLARVLPLDPGPPVVSRQHFVVGAGGHYGALFSYTIATQNATGWQVWLGFDKVLDAAGNTIYQYTPAAPAVQNASTGTVLETIQSVSNGTPIPTAGRKYRAIIRLVAPGGIVVGLDSVDFPVLSPDATQARVIAAGASQVAFNPITATLNFSANQTAGLAVAEQFNRQFGGAANTNPLGGFYWHFIPLLRYWSVYDTLRNGTFTATVTFAYTPADFPSDPNFREDSLVVCGYNPLSRQLEALPSTLNRAARTVTTAYTKFFDTWVVASKSTILTVVPQPVAAPTEFSLGQNYPNPFNPTTKIKFTIPVGTGHVPSLLRVYDVLGREVATLVNEKLQPGSYERTFDARGLASGVYLYRIQSGSLSASRKLLLVK
jgi:hypothetical protein